MRYRRDGFAALMGSDKVGYAGAKTRVTFGDSVDFAFNDELDGSSVSVNGDKDNIVAGCSSGGLDGGDNAVAHVIVFSEDYVDGVAMREDDRFHNFLSDRFGELAGLTG